MLRLTEEFGCTVPDATTLKVKVKGDSRVGLVAQNRSDDDPIILWLKDSALIIFEGGKKREAQNLFSKLLWLLKNVCFYIE